MSDVFRSDKERRSTWPFMVQTAATGEPMTPAQAGEPITSDGSGTALPAVCQCGGLHSRICERGTKGCTCQHDAPAIEAEGEEQHG